MGSGHRPTLHDSTIQQVVWEGSPPMSSEIWLGGRGKTVKALITMAFRAVAINDATTPPPEKCPDPWEAIYITYNVHPTFFPAGLGKNVMLYARKYSIQSKEVLVHLSEDIRHAKLFVFLLYTYSIQYSSDGIIQIPLWDWVFNICTEILFQLPRLF